MDTADRVSVMDPLAPSPSPSPSPDPRLLACLALVARERASDLFLMAGAAPTIKRQGAFIPIAQQVLSAADVRQMAYSILREAQRKEFEATMECDLSLQTADGERFRVNVHMQRGQLGMVIRHVIARIPTLEELGLPPVLQRLAFLKGGLVLTVGSAGSGKPPRWPHCWTIATRTPAGTSSRWKTPSNTCTATKNPW